MGRKPIRSGGLEIERKERKAEAVRLRKDGLSLKQIGDIMGLSAPTIYYYIKDVSNSINELMIEDIKAWRGVQLERLELYADVIHETLSDPQGVTPDGKQERRLQAILTGLKVMDRTAKLLGLDMPTKIEDVTPRDQPFLIFEFDPTKPPTDE
jgi:AcrR family transcriptional regulator